VSGIVECADEQEGHVRDEPEGGSDIEPGVEGDTGDVEWTKRRSLNGGHPAAAPPEHSTEASSVVPREVATAVTAKALEEVRRAAERGASTRSHFRRAIHEAGEKAVEAFEMVVLAGRSLGDASHWAFRVGQHAAIAASKLARRHECLAEHHRVARPPGEAPAEHLRHRSLPQGWETRLTKKQLLVVTKLLEPGVSLGRAAKDLAMDRSGMRRTFHRAIARLARLAEERKGV
jgi:hypothetical protein